MPPRACAVSCVLCLSCHAWQFYPQITTRLLEYRACGVVVTSHTPHSVWKRVLLDCKASSHRAAAAVRLYSEIARTVEPPRRVGKAARVREPRNNFGLIKTISRRILHGCAAYAARCSRVQVERVVIRLTCMVYRTALNIVALSFLSIIDFGVKCADLILKRVA